MYSRVSKIDARAFRKFMKLLLTGASSKLAPANLLRYPRGVVLAIVLDAVKAVLIQCLNHFRVCFELGTANAQRHGLLLSSLVHGAQETVIQFVE
jgi:hypothetical protein